MIFLFLDGVGIGKADESNPFFAAKCRYLPFFEGGLRLPDETPIKAIDARLGVDGSPQSATGQTALFTGQNAPALLGGHKCSYPNKGMRKIILEHNILKKLNAGGRKAFFINAYPSHSELFSAAHIGFDSDGSFHFSAEFPEAFKRRISVTSCMMLANRMIPFDVNDIIAKRSIFQDYSNRYLIQRGLEVPEFSPETAAEIIFNTSREFDFILYEYFQTDIFGHRCSPDECLPLVTKLDRLMARLVSLLDRGADTLLVTSDHGNLEDLGNWGHTLNPVPLLTWGKGADQLRDNIASIVDVTPAIVDFF